MLCPPYIYLALLSIYKINIQYAEARGFEAVWQVESRLVRDAIVPMAAYAAVTERIEIGSGVSPDLLDEVRRILTWPATEEQIKSAMQLVPDEVVQMLTASGTPEEYRAKIQEYTANGCTYPVLYPLGDDVHLMVDTFAPEHTASTCRSIEV